MRSFAQIVPTFWMRGSGKKLRGKPWAQLVALYLMSNSESSMIGLYYISRRKIVEEVGMPDAEFQKAPATRLGQCSKLAIGSGLTCSSSSRCSVIIRSWRNGLGDIMNLTLSQ